MNNLDKINVWQGDWGLPSIDSDCLYILAYAKFSKISLGINSTCNPFRTPHGQLPTLIAENKTIDSVKQIIEYLNTKYKDNIVNNLLDSKQSEIISYEFMLKECLYPALQFVWWIDEKNFTTLIRPWYAKKIPFPFNFYYLSKFKKQAKEMIESLFPNEDELTVIESKIYSDAQKCLTVLSTKLGNNVYFFGNKPTSLDAIVYSYLGPLLKAPLPNSALQNHLKACSNLVTFVTRISQNDFSYDYQQYEKIKAKENSNLNSETDDEFPNKKRNQIVAGIFVTIAMVSYAYITKIVEVTYE